MSAVCFCASVTTLVTSVQAPRWFVPLVDGTRRCPIGGDDQREWPPAKLCMVGVVVFNPQAPKSHFLPFLGQDCTKVEFYFIIRLHIGPNCNTYSCLHRWNAPLRHREGKIFKRFLLMNHTQTRWYNWSPLKKVGVLMSIWRERIKEIPISVTELFRLCTSLDLLPTSLSRLNQSPGSRGGEGAAAPPGEWSRTCMLTTIHFI